MPFELVIFDCDGVLVDSEKLSHQTIIEMLGERGIHMQMEEALGYFLGKSTGQSLEAFTKLLGAKDAEEFVAEYRQRLLCVFDSNLKAVAGVSAALDAIRIPYCVASSGEIEKMRHTLGLTGLLSRFENKLTSVTEVQNPKPAPDVYLLAASRHNVMPDHCVVVEDSPTGVKAGVAAGMTVLGYCELTPPDVLLSAGANKVFNAMQNLPCLVNSCSLQLSNS